MYFENYGKIKKIEILKSRVYKKYVQKGIPLGSAIITYFQKQSIKRSINSLNKKVLKEKIITIKALNSTETNRITITHLPKNASKV